MRNSQNFAAGIATAVTLAGCSTPYADRVAYDTEIRNSPGTITLSDPKLYTREALISERAKDIKWVNRLIMESEDSTKVVFRPELVREIEQITAIAAAIGLKFDPAAKLTYNRYKETDDIKQEIDVLKLQLQLDQLKRDAELVRTNFASQTAPVNEDIGKLSSTSTQSSATVSTSATDLLKEAIDKLNKTLMSRLDIDGKLPAMTTSTINPFDDFRDRSAYRDMLKAAQNSTGLDQLHDFANARLIRLNFQATAIPDSNNLHSLGAIKVSVVPPSAENVDTQKFLRNWLEYMNTNKEYRNNTGLQLNTSNRVIQELLNSGSFDKKDVLGIEVLLPVLIDRDGRSQLPSNIYNRSHWANDINFDQGAYNSALSELSSINEQKTSEFLSNICNDKSTTESDPVELRIQEAVDRELSIQYLQLANTVAISIGKPPILTDEIATKLDNSRRLRRQAFEMTNKLPQCKFYSERLSSSLRWKALSETAIPDGNKIRVYEVGPREQVQQVSTVARSANSLALAASLAAANPGSGIGTEAAASYSRQTMGRATALERVPSVVGYSQAGDSSFGWLLGPRAVLNAKGHVDMAQLLKPYDLSVDMSVPGWWPTLNLEVATSWAPSPVLIASGKLISEKNRITVPLLRETGVGFESLTQYLLGDDSRVTIDDVQGGPINACDKSTLLITGRNIWRTKQAFILGQPLDEDAITITADMKGILLSVPAIKPLLNGNFSKKLLLITPFGTKEWLKDVSYVSEIPDDSCKLKNAQTDGASKDAVSVSNVFPSEFVVPSSPELTVTGVNLDKIVAVKLDGQMATIVKLSKDKKVLSVKFDENTTKSIRESENISLEFFEKDKKSGEVFLKASQTRYVRTIRGN